MARSVNLGRDPERMGLLHAATHASGAPRCSAERVHWQRIADVMRAMFSRRLDLEEADQ